MCDVIGNLVVTRLHSEGCRGATGGLRAAYDLSMDRDPQGQFSTRASPQLTILLIRSPENSYQLQHASDHRLRAFRKEKECCG